MPETIPVPPIIDDIDPDKARFFISIAKQGYHSFLMLGTYNDLQVQHLLCRVGKGMDESNICKLLFGGVGSSLFDEGPFRTKRYPTPITYQAYEITYANYLEFVQVLEGLQVLRGPKNKLNRLPCYKPFPGEQKDQKIFKFTSTAVCNKSNPAMNKDVKVSAEHLSIANTCRHTAIQLVERVTHKTISSQVSSWFFRDLPYSSHLEYGVPAKEKPFYILPIPPSAYRTLEPKQKKIAERLYRQIERLALIAHDAKTTEKKFLLFSGLYKQVVANQEALSLNTLLDGILLWKQTHYRELAPLRKTYFWDEFVTRKAASIKVIDECINLVK